MVIFNNNANLIYVCIGSNGRIYLRKSIFISGKVFPIIKACKDILNVNFRMEKVIWAELFLYARLTAHSFFDLNIDNESVSRKRYSLF